MRKQNNDIIAHNKSKAKACIHSQQTNFREVGSQSMEEGRQELADIDTA